MRILKEIGIENYTFTLQNIKTEPITEDQLAEMYALAGSYEALFSKKATLYKTLNLKSKVLNEIDYKNYILQDYTFLSRPVFIIDQAIFIGNSPQNVAAVKLALK